MEDDTFGKNVQFWKSVKIKTDDGFDKALTEAVKRRYLTR
jgi:hypothetical protein